MTTITISMPQSLRDYVESRVTGGGFGNTSEYLRDLIRRDQQRQAQARLEALLIEGLESGEGVEITPEFWERKRQDLIKRHKAGKVRR